MTFAQAIGQALRRYARFSGTSTRRAYWYWRLFLALVSIVASVIDGVLAQKLGQSPDWFIPLEAATGIAFFLPDLAVTSRRLHDAGKSALLQLWQLVPVALALVTLPLIYSELAGQSTALVPHLSNLALALTSATGFSAMAVSVYFLVLLTRPSMPAGAGNRFLPKEQETDSQN